MILNNADNIMFESSEVDKVYYGDTEVWSRNTNVRTLVLTGQEYWVMNRWGQTNHYQLACGAVFDFLENTPKNSVSVATNDSYTFRGDLYSSNAVAYTDKSIYLNSDGLSKTVNNGYFTLSNSTYDNDLNGWKAYLAQRYANGDPLIITFTKQS